MIATRTLYTIRATDNSSDARAAADACNRRLLTACETDSRDAAEAQIASCRESLRGALAIDAEQVLDVYTVRADRTTGEWLGEPEYSHQATRAQWAASRDSDDVHHDTYEHGGPLGGQTRAIAVWWVD